MPKRTARARPPPGRGVFTYSVTGDTYVGAFENDLFGGGYGVMQRRPFVQGGVTHTGWKYEVRTRYY